MLTQKDIIDIARCLVGVEPYEKMTEFGKHQVRDSAAELVRKLANYKLYIVRQK